MKVRQQSMTGMIDLLDVENKRKFK
jgi:hypothetical protein